MKKRIIYWLVNGPDRLHETRIRQLDEKGTTIVIFRTFEQLNTAFLAMRVGIIVVGDEGDAGEVLYAIQKLTTNAEYKGVRLIFSLSEINTDLTFMAYHKGFRDIIPIDLEDKLWLQRFLFTAGSSSTYFPQPLPAMALRNISAIHLPARLIWISPTHMRIEARVRPPLGDRLQLTGKIAEELGLKVITLTVEEKANTDLLFRFSDAMVCRWHTPAQKQPKQKILLDYLHNSGHQLPCKVFAVVKDQSIRNTLLNLLSEPQFETVIALNQNSIVTEPKFFSPDVVLIEDKMASPLNFSRFQSMAANLPKHTPIVVIGRETNFDELRRLAAGRKVLHLTELKSTLAQTITSKVRPKIQPHFFGKHEEAVLVNRDSEYSPVEINFSARLITVHPSAVRLALPFSIGNYGLCRLDSPFLKRIIGRTVFAKVTDAYQETRSLPDSFPHIIECSLADYLSSDRLLIGKRLGDVMQEKLGKERGASDEICSPLEPVVMLNTAPAAIHQEMNADLGLKSLFAENEAMLQKSIRPIEDIMIDSTRTLRNKASEFNAHALFIKLKPLLIFALICLMGSSAIYYTVKVLEVNYDKSGKVYTDQFRRMMNK